MRHPEAVGGGVCKDPHLLGHVLDSPVAHEAADGEADFSEHLVRRVLRPDRRRSLPAGDRDRHVSRAVVIERPYDHAVVGIVGHRRSDRAAGQAEAVHITEADSARAAVTLDDGDACHVRGRVAHIQHEIARREDRLDRRSPVHGRQAVACG